MTHLVAVTVLIGLVEDAEVRRVGKDNQQDDAERPKSTAAPTNTAVRVLTNRSVSITAKLHRPEQADALLYRRVVAKRLFRALAWLFSGLTKYSCSVAFVADSSGSWSPLIFSSARARPSGVSRQERP